MDYNKQTELLNKAYRNSLKRLSKNFFIDKFSGMSLFIEYLKYLRDSMIISNYEDELTLATITTAIAEFEAYNGGKDTKNKVFHWNNFWELVKQNLERWLQLDDSV